MKKILFGLFVSVLLLTGVYQVDASPATGSVLGATVDTTPRIMYWSGKVNQHVDSNGVWLTDPDGSSGAGINKLTYCKKWFPNTTSVEDYKYETTNTWRGSGNTGAYTSTKMSTKCVQGVVVPEKVTSATITATDCKVSLGEKDCFTKITWNVENPKVGVRYVVVTSDNNVTPAKVIIVGEGVSGTVIFRIVSMQQLFKVVDLNNQSEIITKVPAVPTASCVSGANWDLFTSSIGTYCVAQATSTTITASSCSIQPGAKSCSSNIQWNVVNPKVGSTYKVMTANINTSPVNIETVGSGVAGSVNYNIGFMEQVFIVVDSLDINRPLAIAKVTATCATGTTWNGSSACVGVPTTATSATITASSCSIQPGVKNCPSNIKWNVVNPKVGSTYKVITANINNSPVTIETVGSGITGSINYNIGFMEQVFIVVDSLDTNKPLAIVKVSATCAAGTIWNGSSACVGVPTTVTSATITASSCSIQSGSKSCSSNIQWNVVNPKAGSTYNLMTANINNSPVTIGSGITGSVNYNVGVIEQLFAIVDSLDASRALAITKVTATLK